MSAARPALAFSAAQLEALRTSAAGIKTIDPCGPTYPKLCAYLDGLDDRALAMVAKAKIKWFSALALNRCNRRGVAL